MNSWSFSLKPFPSAGLLPHLKITGTIERHSKTLSISYTLLGHLTEVLIPALADMPGRKDSLWEETCFEFFLGVNNSDQYWEFNLSPAGHWNVYRFESYRQGMQEEQAFTSFPFSVQNQLSALRISLKIDLDKIIPTNQTLKIAIGAVTKPVNGTITYWALSHPGPQPDFHREESFILEL